MGTTIPPPPPATAPDANHFFANSDSHFFFNIVVTVAASSGGILRRTTDIRVLRRRERYVHGSHRYGQDAPLTPAAVREPPSGVGRALVEADWTLFNLQDLQQHDWLCILRGIRQKEIMAFFLEYIEN